MFKIKKAISFVKRNFIIDPILPVRNGFLFSLLSYLISILLSPNIRFLHQPFQFLFSGILILRTYVMWGHGAVAYVSCGEWAGWHLQAAGCSDWWRWTSCLAGAGVCLGLELSRHLPNDFGLGLHHIDTRPIRTVISGNEKAVKKN